MPNKRYIGKVILKCKICNKDFRVFPCREKIALFCSRKCSQLGRDKLPRQILVCKHCGKDYTTFPSRENRRECCSKKCASSYRKGIPKKGNTVLVEERKNEYYREKRLEIKRKAFKMLGSRCLHCGFNDERALQIDHVNGDGAHERKVRGGSHYTFYKKLSVEGGGERYQLLCANCNWIKRYTDVEIKKTNN